MMNWSYTAILRCCPGGYQDDDGRSNHQTLYHVNDIPLLDPQYHQLWDSGAGWCFNRRVHDGLVPLSRSFADYVSQHGFEIAEKLRNTFKRSMKNVSPKADHGSGKDRFGYQEFNEEVINPSGSSRIPQRWAQTIAIYYSRYFYLHIKNYQSIVGNITSLTYIDFRFSRYL